MADRFRSMGRTWTVLVIGISLFDVLGCSPRAPESSILHRDSAGVSITESTAPRWSESEGWTVDSAPILDLSTSGTGLGHEFFRVSDAKFLSGSTVVVANAGTNEVRMFSSTGEFLRQVGREGEGPGEFQRILGLVLLRGDSIAVWEDGGRMTLLGPDLSVGRLLSLPFNIADLRILGGSTVIGGMTYPSVVVHEGGTELIREPVPVVRFSLLGEVIDTVAVAAGFEEFMWSDASGHGGGALPLFGRASQLAARGDQVYMGSANEMEFEVLTSSGEVRRIVRIPGFDLSLSNQEIQTEREARLRPNIPAWYRNLVNDLPTPATRPAYSSLHVDHKGFVWLEMFRGRTELDQATVWMVFNPDGEWLGSVTTPSDVRVFDIGNSSLLSVRTDTLGVEHVQVLRLNRG